MRQKIIALDIDGVVANLLPVWVYQYNLEYYDKLDYREINKWDLVHFVKESCGKNIYKYIADPTIYNYVLPVSGAEHGVERLRDMNFRIVFVTSSPNGCSGRKYRWLNEKGFNVKATDYFEAEDKSLIASDFLVDDRDLNVEEAWGQGIIFSAPYNRTLTGYPRVDSWKDIVQYFVHITNQREITGL